MANLSTESLGQISTSPILSHKASEKSENKTAIDSALDSLEKATDATGVKPIASQPMTLLVPMPMAEDEDVPQAASKKNYFEAAASKVTQSFKVASTGLKSFVYGIFAGIGAGLKTVKNAVTCVVDYVYQSIVIGCASIKWGVSNMVFQGAQKDVIGVETPEENTIPAPSKE